MKLVFATHNENKFREVQQLMPGHIELVSLDMIGCHDEIPETGRTLEENAQIKADYVTNNFGYSCFSDDTGLLVEALNGAPGVYTARYGGEHKNSDANMDRVLSELRQISNRKASFKTVIVLNIDEGSHVFEGIINGQITHEKQGDKGFGYDPIFIADGYKKTFAELPLTVKNKISHRGLAMQKLIVFLSSL